MQVPTRPTATERKIEWLLRKTSRDQMFRVNLVIMPMSGCKAFEKLMAAGLVYAAGVVGLWCCGATSRGS